MYRLMDANPENSHLRSALIVTLPFDVGNDEALKIKRGSNIIGKYVSVERIAEIEEGRTVEWRYVMQTRQQINTYAKTPTRRMATCLTPGGSIPQFLSELSIPGQIAKVGVMFTPGSKVPYYDTQDVPHLIHWLKQNTEDGTRP